VVPAPRPASSPAATIGRENAATGALLTVQVMASKPSWISAIVDGEKTVDRLFAAGDERTLEVRRELVLTAADAGAVALTLNGAAAKPLGKNGQAVTARLNPDNFKDYLPAP
jgi:hypothetical protein